MFLMVHPMKTSIHSSPKTTALNAVVQASSCREFDYFEEISESANKSREELRREAREARQWLIDNPAPKSPSNKFLPLSDEPYLDLTDELYFQLLGSGNFDGMPKSDFDDLRADGFLFNPVENSFVGSSSEFDKDSELFDKYHQPFDFIEDLIEGVALVKTCENLGHPPESDVVTALADEIKRAIQSGQTLSDYLEYDDKKRKREQKRIKPVIKPAKDFYVLRELLDVQKAKKNININDLKLLDFNGTDFAKTTEIAPNLKLSDFHYTDFKQVRAIDTKTGEVYLFDVKGKGFKRHYIIRSAMSKRDDRLSMQKVMRELLPEYRVSKCGCVPQSNDKGIRLLKSKAFGTISVSNMQTDGSVWHCAVCAAKITERRRVEMNRGTNNFKLRGGFTSFGTRTAPHTRFHSLASVRNKFRLADKYMKETRQYKNLRVRFNIHGDIKAFELTVTWLNGWHLHVHEIFFHNAGAFEGEALQSNPAYVAFLKEFEEAYYEIWRVAAVKAGFEEPSRKHGLQIQNGDFAADYVAKWGCEPESKWDASAELTKGHIKTSRKGVNMWDLIRLYRDTGDERLIPIIQEYAHTMHGQRQLIWSPGLKDSLGINDLTDEEIAAELVDDAEEICVLSPMQWKFIVKNDLRSLVFDFAAEGCDVLTDFLHSFEDYPKIFRLGVHDENS